MLIPIKIKVCRKQAKHGMTNCHPNLNKIDPALRNNLDWSQYFDSLGTGLVYDKKSGFNEQDEVNSDPTCQYAAVCVPPEFAEAAEDLYPDRIEIITEEEFEDFYDNRAMSHLPDEEYDTDVLQALVAKKQLGIELSEDDLCCLNPDHEKNGIRKNWNKKWSDRKQRQGIVVDRERAKRRKELRRRPE